MAVSDASNVRNMPIHPVIVIFSRRNWAFYYVTLELLAGRSSRPEDALMVD